MGRRSVLGRTLATSLGFLILEGLLFRTGWCNRWLEPNSSPGQVEGFLTCLAHAPRGPTCGISAGEVVVLGDSRIAHGLSVPAADTASGNRLRFGNLGIVGTLPSNWYYKLRDADPVHRRFTAVVLALDHIRTRIITMFTRTGSSI
jgi:hypothetical protein